MKKLFNRIFGRQHNYFVVAQFSDSIHTMTSACVVTLDRRLTQSSYNEFARRAESVFRGNAKASEKWRFAIKDVKKV